MLEPIGTIPPAEAEARVYAQSEELAMVAQLKPTSLRKNRGGSFLSRPSSLDLRILIAQTGLVGLDAAAEARRFILGPDPPTLPGGQNHWTTSIVRLN